MWLARYCENMTKKAVEKEKAMKAQNSQSAQPVQQARPVIVASNQPTMSGFLNN
jgi:hypothetical protein